MTTLQHNHSFINLEEEKLQQIKLQETQDDEIYTLIEVKDEEIMTESMAQKEKKVF